MTTKTKALTTTHRSSSDLSTVHAEVERLADVASTIIEANKSQKTKRDYESRWRAWCAFCKRLELDPSRIEVESLLAWIAKMAEDGGSYSLLRQSLAALASKCVEEGLDASALDDRLVKDSIKGFRRLYGKPPKPKKAILLQNLKSMLEPKSETLYDLREAAALSIGWFSAMRRGELVKVRMRDVERSEEGLLIKIGRSKTDQAARGAMVAIPYQSDSRVCPVRSFDRWVAAAGLSGDDYLFCAIEEDACVRSKHVSDKWLVRLIKRRAKMLGLEELDYAGHSLRRGFATEAARRKKALDAVKKHLRHKSVATTIRYMEEANMFSEESAAMGLT